VSVWHSQWTQRGHKDEKKKSRVKSNKKKTKIAHSASKKEEETLTD
jgi:hypothetical protein